MKHTDRKLTASQVRDLLDYNPRTGAFHWRVDVSSRVKVGDAAGWRDKDGYLHIRVNGKLYLAHRLAWLYARGEWPPQLVDHVNCDPSDNRLSNLRLASHSENLCNRGRTAASTTGIKGVYRSRDKWRAAIRKNRSNIHLGVFDSPVAAQMAYEEAAAILHGAFARTAA